MKRNKSGQGPGSGLDALFRDMASRYADMEGAGLLEEQAGLERNSPAFPTPGLDKRVLGVIRARKRTRALRGLALVAACFVLVLLIPRLIGLDGGVTAPAPSSAGAESAALAESSAEAAVPDEQEYGLIPLGFDLPENFTVSAVEQDRGQSIYYLDNSELDDVVLSLELAGEGNPFGGLSEIDLGAGAAYGQSTADYSLLRFQKDDILYTLTCRHDINTLAALGRSML